MNGFTPEKSMVVNLVGGVMNRVRLEGKGQQLYIYNDGDAAVFFAHGGPNVDATNGGMAIPGKAYFVLNIGTADYFSFFSGATLAVCITRGTGT